MKDNKNNISPISQLLTNVFLDIFVSNPVLNVVDAAPNVISNVVDLKGDALLKTDNAIRQDHQQIRPATCFGFLKSL